MTCEVNVRASTVRCGELRQPALTADTIVTSSLYLDYVFSSVQYDAAAHLHSLDVKVHNKLGQAIGTPDGSAVTGVRLYIDRVWTIQGRGTVTAANMDDSILVNGARQPAWLYDQSVAAGGLSSARTIQFRLPSTVQNFGFRIGVYTAFPAEQQVTLMPPASEPSWYEDDSSWATHPAWGTYLKRVAAVRFNEAATLTERQLAVAYVGGTVVGGYRVLDGADGAYDLLIEDDGTGTQLFAAVDRLNALPQVSAATPHVLAELLMSAPRRLQRR
ncbi:MAG: hypothetical protein ACREON_13305 [Gemmatimonadaceae bacterium]